MKSIRVGSHYIILANVCYIDTNPEHIPDTVIANATGVKPHRDPDEEVDEAVADMDCVKVVFNAPAVAPVDGTTALTEWYTGGEAQKIKRKASSLC